MERHLICPRTEICPVYTIYVEQTNDDSLGIIKVSPIENRDYYSCIALQTVETLIGQNRLSEDVVKRLRGVANCLLIEQANKSVDKRRPDL